MSRFEVASVETVVQPFREACGRLLDPVVGGMVNAEVLGAELRRQASEGASDLRTMSEGLSRNSAAVALTKAFARSHREEEHAQQPTVLRLCKEVDQSTAQARRQASQDQGVVEVGRSSGHRAQQVSASLNNMASTAESLHDRVIEAEDRVAASVDRLRALVRHQGTV